MLVAFAVDDGYLFGGLESIKKPLYMWSIDYWRPFGDKKPALLPESGVSMCNKQKRLASNWPSWLVPSMSPSIKCPDLQEGCHYITAWNQQNAHFTYRGLFYFTYNERGHGCATGCSGSFSDR